MNCRNVTFKNCKNIREFMGPFFAFPPNPLKFAIESFYSIYQVVASLYTFIRCILIQQKKLLFTPFALKLNQMAHS
jgi:hypothetical protein